MFILRGLEWFGMKSAGSWSNATEMLCPRALQQEEAAGAGGSAPSSPEHTSRRATQVHQHWVLTNMCHARNASSCCSLSFPISSLAAPRDCTGANVDGQQGWAVAIVACDEAETSWYPPGQGIERRCQGSQHSRGWGSLQEEQGRVLKIWSWSRTTQTWNHLTKTEPSLWPRELPQF